MAPLNGVRKPAMNSTNDEKTLCMTESHPGEKRSNEEDLSPPHTATTAAVPGSFISDMLSIRSLATCSICDQLLYEPWTLGCGHTYCYSCLCSWFLPNKRRKTCPDCRTAVKHIPAPAFLLKQMVDILLKRTELMPVDENTEQHEQRRKEENDIVETDRAGEGGLFKGCFGSSMVNSIYYDEEDLIRRCSGCGHEYNGGPTCQNCGQEVDEEYDFSNSDDGLSMNSRERDYLAEMEIDMDGEDYDEDEDAEDERYGYGSPHWGEVQLGSHLHHYRFHSSAAMDNARHFGTSDSDDSDGEEPTQADLDFIDDDVTNGIPHIHYTPSVTSSYLSRESGSSVALPSTEDDNDSDEHDEGGDVSNGRRRHPRRRVPSSNPSVVTVPSTNASEAGDRTEASDHRRSRWSPLDNGNEVENYLGESSSEVSDTDTMVGNQESVDEDDEERYRDTDSSTPRYQPSPARHQVYLHDAHQRGIRSGSAQSTTSEEYGSFEEDNVDSEGESVVDREGDTDMSVSPTASPRSDHSRRPSVEILGSATTVREIESDSSDESVRAPVRRRRGQRVNSGRRSHATGARVNPVLILQQAALRDLWRRPDSSVDIRVNIRRTGNERMPLSPRNYRPLSPRRATESRRSWDSSISPGAERSGRIRRQYRGFVS